MNPFTIVLLGFVNNTSQDIQIGSIGAIDADNKHSNIYHMVEFTPSPYTLKGKKPLTGKSLSLVD